MFSLTRIALKSLDKNIFNLMKEGEYLLDGTSSNTSILACIITSISCCG